GCASRSSARRPRWWARRSWPASTRWPDERACERINVTAPARSADRAKRGRAKSVDRSVIRELEAIVGAEHVRTDPGDVEPYSRDATPAFRAVPDGVVWPRTAEEVAAILKDRKSTR